MAENGKKNEWEDFSVKTSSAGSTPSGEAVDESKEFPNKGEVSKAITNAFNLWLGPEKQKLQRLHDVLDTIVTYMSEVGIEVKNGKIVLDMKEMTDWAKARNAATTAPQTGN